jgi:PII-like signaling protein
MARVKRKEERHKDLKPRSKEAGSISGTTLLQGITEIGTQRAMKNHRKALHEQLPTHIPKKSTEGNICRPAYKLPHVGITLRY